MKTVARSFYDPAKTYEENFEYGPFSVPTKELVHKNDGRPKFEFLGKKIYSPFGIAAGSLLNSKYIKYALERGFDVVVYKTQRSTEFPCNPFPNILYVDVKGDLTLDKAARPLVGKNTPKNLIKEFTITNSFGIPSKGPNFWMADLKKALAHQDRGQLVIASVVGTIKEGFSSEDYFNDFANAAEMAASTGVEAVEINLSCPNVAAEGVLCYTYSSVAAICEKVRKKIGSTPLIIKLGYFSKEQEKLLEKTMLNVDKYVNAVSAINTLSAPIVDPDGNQALPGPNRLKSGVCGAAIKWAGIDMVKRLDRIRRKNNLGFEIVGVGGVMTPQDFHQYRNAGADIVMSVTGAMWDPELALKIKRRLKIPIKAQGS